MQLFACRRWEMENLDERARDRIIEATYKAVRKYGIDRMRVQHIGSAAGLPPGAMYRYFGSKEELLETCFNAVDKQAAAVFDQADLDPQQIRADPEGAVRALWQPYYRFWIDHPDETLFYHRFRDRVEFPEFDRERDVSYSHSLAGMTRAFQTAWPGLKGMDQSLLRLHILTNTVSYAKYVVEGTLPDTQETEDTVFRLLTAGLSGFFREA